MLGCDLGLLRAQAGGEAGDVRLELANQDTAIGELRRQVTQLPRCFTQRSHALLFTGWPRP